MVYQREFTYTGHALEMANKEVRPSLIWRWAFQHDR
jgi:hypothetical protein